MSVYYIVTSQRCKYYKPSDELRVYIPVVNFNFSFYWLFETTETNTISIAKKRNVF